MQEYLNSVVATVTIDGNKISFLNLKLEQEFNSHHKFEILVNYRTLENKWMDSSWQVINLIGTEVVIHFLQKNTGNSNLFIGIIRQISYVGHAGVRNQILISGFSPTILMDCVPIMDSFTNSTLNNIVTDAVTASGNGVEVKIKPVFPGQIDYFCQYEESCFEFLNRLSWIYGEWFYYNGENVIFGNPRNSDILDLIYNVNLSDMEVSAQFMPPKISRYDYSVHRDKEISLLSHVDNVDIVGYGRIVSKRSASLYKTIGNMAANVPVTSTIELEQLMNVENNRSVGEMLSVRGRSSNCSVGLGKTIRLKLPKTMEVSITDIDSFIIQKVVHTIDGTGKYHNEFIGFVCNIENIPMSTVKLPKVSSLLATVTSNADSKGRVKVQMQWQKPLNKETNWIRVQTPDAGSGEKGPRGSVFIPEVGDQVMLGFERDDPNRPYVKGSFFSESTGTGGGQDNHLKSIITKSGRMLEFDDAKDSLGITLKDCKGGIIHINTKENSIDITALEAININASKINLNAKDISLNTSNSLVLNSMPENHGGEGEIDIKAYKTMNLVTETDSLSISAMAKDILLKANTELSAISETSSASVQAATDVAIEGADILVTGSSTARISSSDTDIV